MQAILEAYTAGSREALIMEDDMHVLRWPNSTLIATAPPDWDILLLYMMGPKAEANYLCDGLTTLPVHTAATELIAWRGFST